MKVRAIAKGLYGNRRRLPGEVFILKPYKKIVDEPDPKNPRRKIKKEVTVSAEAQFSEVWMEEADATDRVVPQASQRQFGKHIKGNDQSSEVARDVNDARGDEQPGDEAEEESEGEEEAPI